MWDLKEERGKIILCFEYSVLGNEFSARNLLVNPIENTVGHPRREWVEMTADTRRAGNLFHLETRQLPRPLSVATLGTVLFRAHRIHRIHDCSFPRRHIGRNAGNDKN